MKTDDISLFGCGKRLKKSLVALTLFAICSAACRKAQPPSETQPPLVEEISRENIRVTMIFDPPRVHLDRDILMTLRIVAPSNINVYMPSLADRLTGFQFAGSMDNVPKAAEGLVVNERKILLTPIVSQEYRIGPLPISYSDKNQNQPAVRWFPTKPIIFSPDPSLQQTPPTDIVETISPVWIRPSATKIIGYIAAFCATAGLLYGAWKLVARLRRSIRLRRMSPEQLAMHDLDELLASNLIKMGKIKEFYLRLTMIVRVYIENTHGIRAPEQTTEEFLAAASKNPCFAPDTLARLRSFLQAADLVKFAAHRPDSDTIANSIATAKEYIQGDAAAKPQGGV